MKLCRICQTDKPIADFYKHKNTLDKLRTECKVCWNNKSLDYYLHHKERLAPLRKEYHYKKNYGLSLDQLQQMAMAQGYRCAICETEAALVVDHNHETGAVRGLLCVPCNQGLGLFKDNLQTIRSAIKYLKELQIGNEDV